LGRDDKLRSQIYAHRLTLRFANVVNLQKVFKSNSEFRFVTQFMFVIGELPTLILSAALVEFGGRRSAHTDSENQFMTTPKVLLE
jgi:hypothetical protein